MRTAISLLVTAVLAAATAGCSDSGTASSAGPPPRAVPTPMQATPPPASSGRAADAYAGETGAHIAKPKPPRGRAAPPARSGPLRFTRTRIFKTAGKAAGTTNVTNRGTAYLNRVRFSWRLLARKGVVLDRGTSRWPALAPGETATVALRGTRRYSSAWVRVAFTFRK